MCEKMILFTAVNIKGTLSSQPSDDVWRGGTLRKSTRLSHELLISMACIVDFEFLFARVRVLFAVGTN